MGVKEDMNLDRDDKLRLEQTEIFGHNMRIV
jgi:hypothetical protein